MKVWFGKNFIPYIFLMIFLAALTILYDSYITLIIFLMFVLLPFVLFITLLFIKNKVLVVVSLPKEIVGKNESLLLQIRLVNESIWPLANCNLFLKYGNGFLGKFTKEKLILSIGGRQKQSIDCLVHSDYCGRLDFLLEGVRILDLFCLFSIRIEQKSQTKALVLPVWEPLRNDLVLYNPYVLPEAQEYIPNKTGNDCSELVAIREYQEGDRLNRIHWRLSERQDTLMIKEFGLPLEVHLVILVDFHVGLNNEDTLAVFDRIMDALFLISVTLLEQKLIHQIVWYDSKDKTCCEKQIASLEDFYEVLGFLYECSPYSAQISVLELFCLEKGNRLFTNMFYLTSQIEERVIEVWNEKHFRAWRHVILMKKEKNGDCLVLQRNNISFSHLDNLASREQIKEAVIPNYIVL